MKPTQQQVAEHAAPTELEVRSQLGRILGSSDFTASERQRRFLEFVVEAALTGNSHQIKAFTIATEVFGRREDFDPQVDPIVRVEAGRLRRQLVHYYLAEGATAPVVVEIPRGGYVPQFSYRSRTDAQTGPEAPTGPATKDARSRSGRWTLAAASLILLTGVGLGLWWLAPRSGATRAVTDGAPPRGSAIRVMVLPFDYATDTSPHPLLGDSLTSQLIATLSALSNVEVLALSSGKEAAERRLTSQELADSLQIDYVIEGDVRQAKDRLRVNITVIEAASSLVRTALAFDGGVEDIFELEVEMARDIADSIAVVADAGFERRLQTSRALDAETSALYQEAMTFRIPTIDPVRSRLAEAAYRRVIELDPDFAGGHAGLAFVLTSRSWWRTDGLPEADPRLALASARRAVEIDPEFGLAQATLALAMSINGDHDGALTTARRAAELAQGDPKTLIYAAVAMMFGGELEDAARLATSAIRLDPLTARSPYRNILGVILFQAGEYQQSIEVMQENVDVGGPDGPHMAYFRAGALAALGRINEARRERDKVPNFPYEFDFEYFMNAFRHPEERSKLMAVLRPLGLE